MTRPDPEAPCPCGLPATFGRCCGPLLDRTRSAPTAERLMRSRYTAFAVGDVEHLRRTWHPGTCPSHIHLGRTRTWTGLDVLATTAGGMLDQVGTVEFVAHHRDEPAADEEHLHECSRFERVDGAWVYVGPEPSTHR